MNRVLGVYRYRAPMYENYFELMIMLLLQDTYTYQSINVIIYTFDSCHIYR
jgi:hypothetical protein